MPIRARQLVVCAGVALGVVTSAHAVVNTRIDILASYDGVNFSSAPIGWNGGGIVHADIIVNVTYTGTESPVGFNTMRFQPVVSNWNPAFAMTPFTAAYGSNTTTPSGAVANVPGQYGRISPFAWTNIGSNQRMTGHVHTNGSGGAPAGTFLRIAQAQVTSWIGGTGNTSGGSGVITAQVNNVGRSASEPAFNPSTTSVTVFRFGVDIDSSLVQGIIPIDIPLASFGNIDSNTGERQVWWWGSIDEAAPSIRGTAVVNQGFLFAPTPGTAMVAAVGLLATFRRRRSTVYSG